MIEITYLSPQVVYNLLALPRFMKILLRSIKSMSVNTEESDESRTLKRIVRANFRRNWRIGLQERLLGIKREKGKLSGKERSSRKNSG